MLVEVRNRESEGQETQQVQEISKSALNFRTSANSSQNASEWHSQLETDFEIEKGSSTN